MIRPAQAAPRGSRRLLALCDAFLSHVERRVFPARGDSALLDQARHAVRARLGQAAPAAA